MGLSISTTPAKIEIETTPGSLKWHTKAAGLALKQKLPHINIKTEQVQVQIDQYPCFAEEGLKNNTDFMKEQAQKGYRNGVSYTGKIARDGDSMARIGYHANIMIDIAKRDSVKKRDFNMDYIPKSRPKIGYKGGTLEMKADFINNVGEINGVTGSYTPANMSFSYSPSKVDIRVVSYGSVNIKYTGVDEYV